MDNEKEKPEHEKPTEGRLIKEARQMVRSRVQDLEERMRYLREMVNGPLGHPYEDLHQGLYNAAQEEKDHWERMLPILEQETKRGHE